MRSNLYLSAMLKQWQLYSTGTECNGKTVAEVLSTPAVPHPAPPFNDTPQSRRSLALALFSLCKFLTRVFEGEYDKD